MLDTLEGLKVLYIEDDKEQRDQLKLFLKRRVGKLFVGKNGKEGFDIFNKENPDLVITDLRMPEIDGIELSKMIRKIRPLIPIIITTAFSDVETVLEAVDIGITKYILKPIDSDELLDALTAQSSLIEDRKDDTLVVSGKVLIKSREERIEKESKLQIAIAKLIKTTTGKGPKNVKVFVKKKRIEVDVLDSLTPYEKRLLINPSNKRLVRFSREAYYGDCIVELKEILKEILGRYIYKIENINIDLEKEMDTFTISIK